MVNPLTAFVQSLGNDRAVANAQAALDARRRDDWLVQGVRQRLEALDRRHPPTAEHAAAVGQWGGS